jgi:hypothetical protein
LDEVPKHPVRRFEHADAIDFPTPAMSHSRIIAGAIKGLKTREHQ